MSRMSPGMKSLWMLVLVVVASAVPARAELLLFARYDWQDGAKDVSGSAIRHDGLLEAGASVAGGKLILNGWDGVGLGEVPELNGAGKVLFGFEDVTFAGHGDPAGGPVCHSPVLFGDDMQWRAGVFFDLPPYGPRTQIQFSMFDWPWSLGMAATVADQVVDHFDSIEYRFDGAAPLAERLAVRWNDGPWITGAEGDEELVRIHSAMNVRINNGGPADEDPMWGSMGAVSLYSDQVPEPGTAWVVVVAAGVMRRRWRRDAI